MAKFPYPLPVHPYTGARALGFRRDGRPIWPITGSDGSGEGGTATATLQRIQNPSPMLQRLYDERDQLIAFVDQTVAGANVEGQVRDLSASELDSLTRTRTRIDTQLDPQIIQLERHEQLRQAGGQAQAHYAPTVPPGAGAAPGGTLATGATRLGTQTRTVTHRYTSRGKVIVDQLRAAPVHIGGAGDVDARDRLLSAGAVFAGATDEQIRAADTNKDAIIAALSGADQLRVTQITTDTPGILPVPIVGDVMNDVDAARPFISSVGAKPLDFPGETFKRPLITQHVAMGKQTTQATTTGLGTQKLVIGSVTFTKETWGGYLDVSRQDIDWTSPAAWDALLNDFTDQYGLATENAAADAFVTATAGTPIEVAGTGGASTLKDWITALYTAAQAAYTGAGRLPDTIWMSMDVWGIFGPLIESQVATNESPGSANIGTFDGNLLKLPRYVVPSMASGTLVIGNKRWTEVYEERIGLLQAVLPSVLGVQIAYGGYVAYNTIKAAAFKAVVNLA